MDLTLDQPPPQTAQPMSPAATPTPPHPPAHNHPPYAEMITVAISALKERDGSSKRAILKYIESNYSNLPSTHSALLSHHLKRLKNRGQVLMVKHSYKLPRSGPADHVSLNGAAPKPPSSIVPKKRPGRPPKSVQALVPVFVQEPVPVNAVPFEPLGSVYVTVGTVNVGDVRPAKLEPKRGPGRPAKSGGVQGPVGKVKGRGRPMSVGAKVKRPVRRQGVVPVAVGVVSSGVLPVGNAGNVPVVKKPRGRPLKAGGVVKKLRNVGTGVHKKPMRLSGKPLGRPKKDNQLLTAYLDVKAKLEYLQSRIKQTTSIIKPYLTNETAVSAVQELETLATMEVPLNVPHQQPKAETQACPEIQVVLTGRAE